jgi:hypothetical protein
MRSRLWILPTTVLFGYSPASAQTNNSFDGHWLTTVSCPDARDALGYSFRFISEVKDGRLSGTQGVNGKPSSLHIEGDLGSDGQARLYATGHTGSKEFVPGRDTPRGTSYGYDISAHFDQRTGAGARLEGRPCSLSFEKQ